MHAHVHMSMYLEPAALGYQFFCIFKLCDTKISHSYYFLTAQPSLSSSLGELGSQKDADMGMYTICDLGLHEWRFVGLAPSSSLTGPLPMVGTSSMSAARSKW